jgi:FkbM family methyltransferase
MITTFTDFLDKKSYTPSVIFDIGSRDCKQSVEFTRKYPNAKVFAFEANPDTIPLCKKNIQHFPNITLVEGAVHEYNGMVDFYKIDTAKTRTTWADGNPGASSLFIANGTYPHEYYIQNKVTVPCFRLDTICKKYSISPDTIWIDLQGAELLAFKSLGSYLVDCKYIHTEVSHKPIYNGQCMFSEVDSFLTEANFKRNRVPNTTNWQEDIIYDSDYSST